MVEDNNLSGLTVEERNTLAVLAQHVGRDNPVSSRELRADLLKQDREGRPDTRRLVRSVMMKTGVPIGANNQGYYIIADEQDFAEYSERLFETINGTEKRLMDVSKAFFLGDTEATEGELIEAVVDELIEELMA